jgi:hypothetical protein
MKERLCQGDTMTAPVFLAKTYVILVKSSKLISYNSYCLVGGQTYHLHV